MKKFSIIVLLLVFGSFVSKDVANEIPSIPEKTQSSISVSLIYDYQGWPCTAEGYQYTLNVYGPSEYVSYCITNLSGCTINISCLDSNNGDVIDRYTLSVTSSSGISFRVKAYNYLNQWVDYLDVSYIDCEDFYQ